MTFQLIAFDMDGTLLRSDHTIDPRTISAIARASQAGKAVVLATGRSVSELRPYLADLPKVRYGVLSSGGLLYDFQAGRVLARKYLPDEVVQMVLATLQTEDVLVVAMSDGQGYLQSSQFERIEQFYMGQFRQLYLDTAVFVPDLSDLMRSRPFEKINIYYRTSSARETAAQRFASSAISLVKAEKTGLELIASGADKGAGLTLLCQELGLTMAEVIGVGDAENDRTMLEMSGLGLAMGNARPEIQAVASHVLASHDQGGCVEAIERYLLSD